MEGSFTDQRSRRRRLPKPLRKLRKASRFLRDSFFYLLIQIVRCLLRLLPLSSGLALGARAGRLAGNLLHRTRRRAIGHLGCAFPDSSVTWREQVVTEVFANMGRSVIELLKLGEIRGRIDEHVDCPQLGTVEEILRSGTGAIVCTGHIGNWELLAAYFGLKGVPLTVIGRQQRNPLLNRLVVDLRRRSGVTTIARSSRAASRQILRVLRARGVLGMLIDQDTRGPSVFVPFFGRLASTPSGPAVLALRVGVPVFAAFIHRQADGKHIITLEQVPVPETGEARAKELTATLTRLIEQQIRAHPTEWVWWHRRWRRRPPAAPG